MARWTGVDPVRHDQILDAILARYRLVHTGNANTLAPHTDIVVEQAPVDKDYDSRATFGVGRSGISDSGFNKAD